MSETIRTILYIFGNELTPNDILFIIKKLIIVIVVMLNLSKGGKTGKSTVILAGKNIYAHNSANKEPLPTLKRFNRYRTTIGHEKRTK